MVVAVGKELMVFDGAGGNDLVELCAVKDVKKPTKKLEMTKPIVFLSIIDTMLLVQIGSVITREEVTCEELQIFDLSNLDSPRLVDVKKAKVRQVSYSQRDQMLAITTHSPQEHHTYRLILFNKGTGE